MNRTPAGLVQHEAVAAPVDTRTAAAVATRTARQLAAALDILEGPSAAGPDLGAVLDIEREVSALGMTELAMRARLLRVDALLRAGETATAVRLAWEVNGWAAEHGNGSLLAESHHHLVWIEHLLGDPAAALDHAVRALELLDDSATSRVRAYYLVRLADALAWAGSLGPARGRYREAEQILTPDGSNLHLLMTVLNNLCDAEHQAGEHQRAWAVAERMLALASEHAFPMGALISATVAEAQLGVGLHAEAEQTMQTCLEQYHTREDGDAHDIVDLLLTLAKIQRHHGDTDVAQATLDQCRDACEERGLPAAQIRVQQEQAELYAAAGQPQRAFDAHKIFHDAAESLRSLERSTEARIRQSIRETIQARQQSDLFREQARRDPLTGLRNRRFVDEELPALLDVARAGGPLSLALMDLDYFKRINDLLSHDIGDQVLVLIARLLTASVADVGFVARLGGDEFLVVLPGLDRAQAAGLTEAFRNTVGAYDWTPITGIIPVTVSVGIACALKGGDTQPDLLGRADEQLYAAKRAGRNRAAIHADIATDRARHPGRRSATASPLAGATNLGSPEPRRGRHPRPPVARR